MSPAWGHGVTSLGSSPWQEHSSGSGHSPQAHEEDEGHEEGPQRDAVPQVVDDDGDVVVQLALLLAGADGEGISSSPRYPHKPTSSTTSPLSAVLQILGPFSKSNLVQDGGR